MALVVHIGSPSRNYRLSQQHSNLEKKKQTKKKLKLGGGDFEMVKRRKPDVSEAGKKGTEG